ncbi:helix-turn-helix domain-containing protein [Paenibacillus alvei]|uniref:helix-turn-helix transcriptional regulator n=1 Tax=Paenibacillus alvei TaxID=44250 RepID=UPI0022843893|nr:helix-turn-helix transcriptional regulator [Paenibacillus alvei]MCY9541813.1 helix-turn-helix domain-containing protein [Paenibacillus alvei]MCY9704999.1 helix-turn-helix domain-containing protein [Paenibacillus alvei]MEC0082490.1 helix-turn-helix transcriptional regulator [Paenibacillus alvei]
MIRAKLKDIRESSGKTNQEVADSIGITKSYYWQIENGKRGLYYDMAVKIAAVFGLTPDDIFLPDELTKSEHTDREVS